MRGYRELTKVYLQMKDQSHTLAAGVSMPALEATSLSKNFGGIAAVDDVSLCIERGEIVGLIGPNGAGKTTLFDLLAGVRAPTAGRIAIAGRAVQDEPAHRRLARGLGRTFQIPRPFPELSVLDNVMLGAQGHSGERLWANWVARRRVTRHEHAARVRAGELLEFVALSALADRPARVLSGGQRKLLELARVLMASPSVVLLDEPAAGVHPRLLELIASRIVALNGQGMTFLVIEHNMDFVASLCSRLVVMAQGRVLCQGPPSEVVRDHRVVEAYLGGAAA